MSIQPKPVAMPAAIRESESSCATRGPAALLFMITIAAPIAMTISTLAMPTMNMPAMQNGTTLPHVGGGVYRGPGQVLMGGRWDVTVTVGKNGQSLGQKQFALVAR